MILRALCLAVLTTLLLSAATYTYDAAGHLAKIDYGNGSVVTYTYDKAGNLVGRTTGPSVGGPSVISSVNTAGSPASAGIAQNTWIEIKGTNLVPASSPAAGVIWSDAPEFKQGRMPIQLGGVSVTVNGKPAYVYYFCSAATSACPADQVNALTPLDDNSGSAQIVVTSGSTSSAPFTVSVKPVVPSLLLFTAQGYVAATHANFSLLGPVTLYPGATTPASPGETVTVYAVGFGLPSAALVAGASTQTGSLPVLPVCTVATRPAAVRFAGVISPGLYQLNITVPPETTSGDKTIACSYGGGSTPAGGLLSVQ